MNRNVKLGKLGEKTFDTWCTSVELVVNKSNEDEMGWDFYVEFPFKKSGSTPMDMQPTPIECKIQVKATRKQDKKIDIEVSNLFRLIRTPMPVFICIFEFDEKDQVISAYLIHIWEDIIGKTLKRVRELDVSGERDELNKKTIAIRYGNDESMKVIDGKSLLKAIEICVPGGIEKYLERKKEFLSNLGFEDGGGDFKFTLTGEKNLEDLLDMALGIKKKVKVDRFVAFNKRFGILSKQPSCDNGDGELFFLDIKPIDTVNVKFKEKKLSPGVSFLSKLYTSPLNRVVSKELVRLRIEGIFFDIVWLPFKNEFKFSFSLDFEKRFALKELRDILYALNILKNCRNGLIIEFVIGEDPPFSFNNINLHLNDIRDFSILYDISDNLLSICQKLRIPENDILVSIHELFKCSKSIEKFYGLMVGPGNVKIEFSIETGVYNGKSKMVCLKFFQTKIGNKVFGCVIGMVGMPTLINQAGYQYLITPEKITIGPTLVCEEGEAIDKNEIEGIIEEFSEQFCKEDYFPIIFDGLLI